VRLTTFFIDLDDTIYPASSGIWTMIRDRMSQYMHDRLGLPWEQIPALRRTLFETYGTTMRGLQATYQIDTQDFLAYVHDVPVREILHPDPELKRVLLSFPQRKIIFTNADAHHAVRVLDALQLRECFESIVDIVQIAPACKPQPVSFQTALRIAGENDPGSCLFIDDSPHNLAAAKTIGFITMLVGASSPHPAAHYTADRLIDMDVVLSDFRYPAARTDGLTKC